MSAIQSKLAAAGSGTAIASSTTDSSSDVTTVTPINMNDSIELYELIISQLQVVLEKNHGEDVDIDFPSTDDASILANNIGGGGRDIETGDDGNSFSSSVGISSQMSNSSVVSAVSSQLSTSRTNSWGKSSRSLDGGASNSEKSSKKSGKTKKEDLMVWDVIVVFPLPAKDPLIVERKMYDFARAFNVNSSPLIRFVFFFFVFLL